MKLEQWVKGTAAKVQGTINLGKLISSHLDFLILLSSVAGIICTIGAGTYCAGNAFQDAFARHHASLGLPVKVINLAMVTSDGMVASRENGAEVEQLLLRQGIGTNTMRETLAQVSYAIQNPLGKYIADAQIISNLRRVNPRSSEDRHQVYQRPDARFSHMWAQDVQVSHKAMDHSDISLHQSLQAASDADTAIRIILNAMQAKISQLLAIPVVVCTAIDLLQAMV